MRIEQGEYGILALDIAGFELGESMSDTIKDAKRRGREMVQEKELIAVGMVKVEVRNHKGECVADFFVHASARC